MEPSPLERPDRDPRVEEYLAQVLEQLPRTMPPACRLEQHAELAAHLEALIAAHIELGSDRETAVLVALQRFGSAGDLGRQLSRQWKRSSRLRASAHELVAAAVVFLGTAFLGGLLPCGSYSGWPTADLGPRPMGPCLDLLVPCLVGCFWGRQQSDRTRLRLVIVLFTALLAVALLPVQPEYQGVPALDLFARSFHLMQWMFLGCSTAGLTATLKVLGERWRNRPAV